MKIIISPAKGFNHDCTMPTSPLIFKQKSEELIRKVRSFTIRDIANEFKVNDELAIKIYYDFQEFDFKNLPYPAIFCYDGLVFKQFELGDFNNLDYLNEHVYILSALYGILKPFTGIRDYRFDMNVNFINMYEFWGNLIAEKLFYDDKLVLNLASNEYYKLIKKYKPSDCRIITISFKELRDEKFKSIVSYTKMQRGRMLKYLIQNEIEDIELIKNYSDDGYTFNPILSKKDEWVFTR